MQLNLKSGRNSHSSKIVCMSSLSEHFKRFGRPQKSGEIDFFRRLMVAYSVVSGGILPKFELIQAFMHIPITCKYEEDPIQNEGARVVTTLYIDF